MAHREGTSTTRHARKQGIFADVFLYLLFIAARFVPWFLPRTRSLWVECGWRLHRAMRQALLANAARIHAPDAAMADCSEHARRVTGHFYDFVTDFAINAHLSREQLLAKIVQIHGIESYQTVRGEMKGAILATAHMGNFEVAMAALVEREPRMHVVFQRDAFGQFERVRQSLRRRLNITEHPAEAGWPMWLELRDALARNEVVLLQADRVLPGQKSCTVPFMGGHTRLPTGPVKLALISGAPIIPVFSQRHADGKVSIFIEEAVRVDPRLPEPSRTVISLTQVGQAIAKHVAARPEQWMMVRKAWMEDLKPWELA